MTPPPPRSSFDKAPKPDIIFILCDQLRADFLSLHGCAAIRTPHIDRLAREGIVYENAVSPQPLCVPARAAMLTGLNPIQSGVISNHHWLRPDRYALGLHTWPDILRDQGYRTASIGKMHFHPFESSEGFDDRIIAEDKRWPLVGDDYAEFLKTRGLEKFNAITHPDYVENQGAVLFPHGTENSPDRFVSMSAADYIRRQPASRPFAMMIGFPGPHCPYDPSEEYLGHVTPDALPPLCPRIDDGSAERTAWHDAFLAENRAAWHALDYATFPT
ncbi:MAG TPA: sulfatase-like hydrolase/transferase, partial [Rariglobus sp.]